MQEEQETIEAHYNIWAERYEENSRVREERSEELISLLHRHVWLLPSEGWADIGCRKLSKHFRFFGTQKKHEDLMKQRRL